MITEQSSIARGGSIWCNAQVMASSSDHTASQQVFLTHVCKCCFFWKYTCKTIASLAGAIDTLSNLTNPQNFLFVVFLGWGQVRSLPMCIYFLLLQHGDAQDKEDVMHELRQKGGA